MRTPDCENVCMAAMALADGYQSEWSSSQIEAHLELCSECRREVEDLRALSTLLDAQARRHHTEDVWKRVEPQLSAERLLASATPERTVSKSRGPFMLLGVLLVGYRIVEMVPDRNLGFLFKLIPVLLVMAAFIYLRENPFKIDTELRLEGE